MLASQEEVCAFWLGELNAQGRASAVKRRNWFAADDAFDQSLRESFGALHCCILAGGCRQWRRTPRGLLAYVLVLDQFSRNMFRGTAGMFAADELALSASFEGLALGFERSLGPDERLFLYMPLMHSERLEVQDRCVELFAAEGGARGSESGSGENLSYAERHRDMIRRFGRFPHRNALLGRDSTPEELEFLSQSRSSF